MRLTFAFSGFRHGHIFDLYKAAREHDSIEITGLCEEDPDTVSRLAETYDFTHTSHKKLLEESDCDVVAVGDYYARRGKLIIAALEAGKHVISDKPVCTRLEELDRIEKLIAEKNLSLGCQLDMRGNGLMIRLKELADEGAIGTIHTICFGGQHPLNFKSRDRWYFEKGRHGGTLNDIAVHGFDCTAWLTGSPVAEILSARCWNARLREVPFFQDAGQCMFRHENGCGVICDVSYLSPDSFGYRFPLYWRFTCHGTEGVLETRVDHIVLFKNGSKEMERIKPGHPTPNRYLNDFISEIQGSPAQDSLTTSDVLKASRAALVAQQIADSGTPGTLV